MIVDRDENDALSGGDPRALHYLFGGLQLGQVGNNGTDNLNYTASIRNRLAPSATTGGAFAGGSTSATPFADFDQSYDAINGSGASSASSYTIAGGETLMNVAQQVWGDSALWYLIADANGLSGSEPLAPGQTLIIPNKIRNNSNTSDTFRPYDPNEALGDTSPTSAKPPKKNNCAIFGQLLLVAIAIGVTAWLTGPASGFFAHLIAGVGTGVAVPTAAAIAGAVVGRRGCRCGGFARQPGVRRRHRVAGQVQLEERGHRRAVGRGERRAGQFSKLAGTAKLDEFGHAITKPARPVMEVGGVAGKVGRFLGGAGFLSGAASSIVSNVATQGLSIATGLQKKFDFAGVAGAGVGGAVSSSFNVGGVPGAVNSAITGAAGGIANAAARSVLTGTDFGDNIMAALPDIIGSTIGQLAAAGIAGEFKSRDMDKPVGGAADAPQPSGGADANMDDAINGYIYRPGGMWDNAVRGYRSAAEAASAPLPESGTATAEISEPRDDAVIVGRRRQSSGRSTSYSGRAVSYKLDKTKPSARVAFTAPSTSLAEAVGREIIYQKEKQDPNWDKYKESALIRASFADDITARLLESQYPDELSGSDVLRQKLNEINQTFVDSQRLPKLLVSLGQPELAGGVKGVIGLPGQLLINTGLGFLEGVKLLADGPEGPQSFSDKFTFGTTMTTEDGLSRVRNAIGRGESMTIGLVNSAVGFPDYVRTQVDDILSGDPKRIETGVRNLGEVGVDAALLADAGLGGVRAAIDAIGVVRRAAGAIGAARPTADALGALRSGEAAAAESKVLSPFTERYLTESGGRWGGTATRQQNYAISQELEARGYSFPERPGGGLGPEEYIPGSGSKGGSYVDITGIAPNGRTVRIQTVTTLADGVTPTASEAAAAARIRAGLPQ